MEGKKYMSVWIQLRDSECEPLENVSSTVVKMASISSCSVAWKGFGRYGRWE